jgi:tRNA nucleotidyltransferase (CCA-adding enzyme)
MLGAVCHDLGKPATTAFVDGRIRSLDHEQAGVEPTVSLLDRLNVHTIDGFDVRRHVIGLVAHHLKPGMFHKAQNVGDGAFRRLAQKVDLELLARLARADCLGRTGPSIARRWTGSSSGRAGSASSISHRRRCCSAVICWSSVSHRARASATC